MRFVQASLLVCAAVAAVNVSRASAAPIEIFGSPTYTPGVGGFKEGEVPFGLSGPSVSDAPAAIGYASKYDAAGLNKGNRALRWGASGAAAELDNLGTNTSGVTDSRANAVNDAGTAAGYARKYDAAGNTKGFRAIRWHASGTAPTDLGTLGTATSGIADSFAYSINDAGVIVGSSTKYDGAGVFKGARAVRWEASSTTPTELGNLGLSADGNTSGQAFAVNSAGTVVGESARFDGAGVYKGTRAVRWDSAGTAATELGNIGTDASGITSSQAYAVNATGTAVGYANKYSGAGASQGERAVRWDGAGSVASELGNLGTNTSGFSRSFAYDVNAAGTAVGHAQKYDGAGVMKGLRAVRWDASSTAAIELGNLGTDTSGFANTHAFAINTAGIIVGAAGDYSDAGTPLGKAVYWGLDGLAIDLNTLIDAADGWTLQSARGISDTGWISGTGAFDPDGAGGQAAYTRLFLLQVPEPSGLALLALGGVALLRRRRAEHNHRRGGRS